MRATFIICTCLLCGALNPQEHLGTSSVGFSILFFLMLGMDVYECFRK